MAGADELTGGGVVSGFAVLADEPAADGAIAIGEVQLVEVFAADGAETRALVHEATLRSSDS